MKMLYQVQRWDHGWTIIPAPLKCGIPLNALNECTNIFPKGAFLFPGIAHHLTETGEKTSIAVATKEEGEKWETEIAESLKKLPLQEQWWKGTGVGLSSASIFAVFAFEPWASKARDMSQGATPKDAGDFGRCHRLLSLFPIWRREIARVGEAYPGTAWPELVKRWGDLETLFSTDEESDGSIAMRCDFNSLLARIHREASKTPQTMPA